MRYEKVWSAGATDSRPLIIEMHGRFFLVPTTSPDGRPLTDEQALAEFSKTQRILGAFSSSEEADRAAGALAGLAS